MNTVKLMSVALASAVMAACASAPKQLPEVEKARVDVQTLEQQPQAQTTASKELGDARNALAAADLALKNGKQEEAVHYAYLASQQARTGEERIDEQKAKREVAQGEAERNRVLLEARTDEAERATAAARAQTVQAEAARQDAENARAEAERIQRELADLQAKQTDRGMVLTLGDVLFDTGAATLKPGAQQALDRIAAFMQKNPDTKVMIEGHTDSRGSDEYNQQLSQHRADAVSTALATRGINPTRVAAVGRGEGFPVASNDDAAGRQQNRRVEIVFSDEQGHFAQGANAVLR